MLRIFFWTIRLIILFLACLWSPSIWAAEDYNKVLKSGLEHYNSENYSEALISWHTILQSKKYAQSTEALYNLGLTEFKLKDFGSSLGHLRRAQALNPLSYPINKTLKLVKLNIEKQDFYRVESESYFNILLNWLHNSVFIVLFILCLAYGTYVVSRQKLLNSTPWTYFKSYVFFAALSLVPLGLLYLQNHIQSQNFATLTGKKEAIIYSASSSKAAEIGVLNVGDVFEIIEVNNAKEKWLGISSNEVPSGWIKADSYIVHRGKIDP